MGWLRLPDGDPGDVAVKPGLYLATYETVLADLREEPFALLELGVWRGDSLVMWRDAFPRATIVGVDLNPPELELGPRVHIVAGDQGDPEFLNRVAAEHAPDGFRVIIDDASHLGELTGRSLQALFSRHLQPGGIYVIEDWGTGYMPDWPDGGPVTDTVGERELAEPAPDLEPGRTRFPSHDLGMVGLVKRLVDHAGAMNLERFQPGSVSHALPIAALRIDHGMVVLTKRA